MFGGVSSREKTFVLARLKDPQINDVAQKSRSTNFEALKLQNVRSGQNVD